MPILYLSLIAIVSAVVWHRLQKRFLLACALSATSAALLFELLAYVEAGSLDPFFMIASVFAFGLSSLISVAIGLLMRRLRE